MSCTVKMHKATSCVIQMNFEEANMAARKKGQKSEDFTWDRKPCCTEHIHIIGYFGQQQTKEKVHLQSKEVERNHTSTRNEEF